MIEASMHVPPGYALFIPSALRKAVDLPVVGVGRFKDPLQAERALAEGHCDLVGVVRGQIADADFAAKARAGPPTTSASACRATRSASGGWASTGGSAASRTRAPAARRVPVPAAPPASPPRVIVVGGGPGGLQAAITAAAQRPRRHAARAQRPTLGGQVRLAASRAEPGRVRRPRPQPSCTECRRARRRRRVPASVAAASRCWPKHPDAVIVATGAEPARPWWARDLDAATVVDVRDVLDGSRPAGRARRRHRRARLPPGHVGRRAARRPRLRRRGRHARAWSSARTSASPSTWRTGTCAPPPRASCRRTDLVPMAWRRAGDAHAAAPPDRRERDAHRRLGRARRARAARSTWLYRELKARRRRSASGRRLRRPAAGARRRHRGRPVAVAVSRCER